jgi:glucose-1-phosphate thymidylyltransferase
VLWNSARTKYARVAWRMGYTDDDQLAERAHALLKSGYGSYLLQLLEQR